MIKKLFFTFLVSMVPVIELRGAIPMGVASGLPFFAAVAVSIVGNLLPIPIVIFFIRTIFAWMRSASPKLEALVSHMEQRAMKKSNTIQQYTFWGLFIFVAIPLPGTGAWTGALIAALLEIPPKRAFLAIVLGVLTAAVIISVATFGVKVSVFS